jgi:D-sedoheptulose 7-phosphate isomerase
VTTAAGADGLRSLYPFLYQNDEDPAPVLDEVVRSTEQKAREIVALREALVERHGERLLACAAALAGRLRAGARLYTFGNGGSSTDAQELAQLFLNPPPPARPLPAWSLTQDAAVMTALSNDVGFEVVFARQLGALARPGDIAIGLSTSGGSRNALAAFDEAARRGLTTVGLCGNDGGRMVELDSIDFLFVVPSPSVHRVQEAQTTLYHVLWELTQQRLTAV